MAYCLLLMQEGSGDIFQYIRTTNRKHVNGNHQITFCLNPNRSAARNGMRAESKSSSQCFGTAQIERYDKFFDRALMIKSNGVLNK